MTTMRVRIGQALDLYEKKVEERRQRDAESDRILEQKKRAKRWKAIQDLVTKEVNAVLELLDERGYACKQHQHPDFHPYNHETYTSKITLTVSPFARKSGAVLQGDKVVKSLLDNGSRLIFKEDLSRNRMDILEEVGPGKRGEYFLYFDEVDQEAVEKILEDFIDKVFL